jgi:phosphopantetheinyl transferase
MRPEEIRVAIPPGQVPGASLLTSDYWQLPLNKYGPVAFASSQLSKEQLLKQLLAALAGQVSCGLGPWQELPLKLVRGSLGQPLVLSDGMPVLSVSFSQAGGRIWGALTGAGRIGIDVAFASEFPPHYPLQRVFSQEEFCPTADLLGGNPSRTAALLWSLKEAAVKALGVGFNHLAPREIVTGPGKPWRSGYLFEVAAGCLVKTWARSEGEGWLALALAE